MFTKKKMVGGIYKTVTDWDTIIGLVFWGGVGLFVLASCGN